MVSGWVHFLNAAADVIITDPCLIRFEPLSWRGDSVDEIRAVLGGDLSKRVRAVIDAFVWNCGSDEIGESGLGRVQTGDGVRALTYLARPTERRDCFITFIGQARWRLFHYEGIRRKSPP